MRLIYHLEQRVKPCSSLVIVCDHWCWFIAQFPSWLVIMCDHQYWSVLDVIVTFTRTVLILPCVYMESRTYLCFGSICILSRSNNTPKNISIPLFFLIIKNWTCLNAFTLLFLLQLCFVYFILLWTPGQIQIQLIQIDRNYHHYYFYACIITTLSL